MPSKIRVLSEQTINKIAAGEVVENAASVVKELIENSLDAGAHKISVELKGGGRQLIRITDDGCGMSRDDALLCFERHATSKIKEVDEIFHIGTMGFRGEAIPSIAAISKFTLMTRESDHETAGTLVLVEGGKILHCASTVRDRGTTIEIGSLFYNVPVRKKFQKSPAYDSNEILKIITALALCHPHVQFQLISDQKTLLNTSGKHTKGFIPQMAQCIREVLGESFLEELRPIEQEGDFCSLHGFIGLPTSTRHNRGGQYLFLNQRYVTSPFINFAIRAGYGTALPAQRHPIYILHITVPGELVDVNVHPQKKEVRLRQEFTLKEKIIQWVSETLSQRATREEIVFSSNSPPALVLASPSSIPYHQYTSSLDKLDQLPVFTPSKSSQKPLAPLYHSPATAEVEDLPGLEPPPLSQPTAKRRIPAIVGMMKGYLIVDGDGAAYGEGIWFIDQKRAHSRILYDQFVQKQQAIPSQALLIPYHITTTPIEGDLLATHLDLLQGSGIHIQQIGPTSFSVEAVPQFLRSGDVASLVKDLIITLQEYPGTILLQEEKCKKILQIISRSTLSSQQQLSNEEAQNLLLELMQSDNPYHCPAGKPIFARISIGEIEKKFYK